MTRVTHLLYLHGFRSSPRAAKARRMAEVAAQQAVVWQCPQLPPSPQQAVALLRSIVNTWPLEAAAVMGSSLGGFYATVLAQDFDCRAVLINPVVNPARELARCLRQKTACQDPAARADFDPAYINQLAHLRPPAITARERYHVLVALGDEVLNGHEMAACYAGCAGAVLEGGNHAFSDFEDHLPGIRHFLGWP